MKAVNDQTSYDPTDKNACVQIPYTYGYHVDIPTYPLNGDSAYLAHYRSLLGSALCVFNSSFSFVIENILRKDPNWYQWHELIVLEGGKLKKRLENSGLADEDEIVELFDSLRTKRNRSAHSF